MVRKGEVSLDDPVSKHARTGAKLPKRGEDEITLRDLVTQTSGLPRMPPIFKPAQPSDPYADFTADTLYEALAVTKLHAQKERYEYSNFGFMWLSEMIGRRGKSYEALLKERVLLPLGMTDTGTRLTPEQEKRFAKGHDASYKVVPHWHLATNLEGVGMLRSSLADMVKLAQAMTGRRETPLEDTIALAVTPIRPAGGSGSTGFGWATRERGDTRVVWHNGGTGGFRSIIAMNPATRTAAIVLVDSTSSFDDLALHLVDPDFPLSRKRVGLATDTETLKQYVGRYELSPTFALEVFVDGTRLMTQGTNQGAIEVVREGPDVFFPYAVPARLRFVRDPEGKVGSLILEQGGRETRGKRVPSSR
jgi:serine-type D-Ala-D-Ala carboxypeptidase/endopeptidase